MSSDIKQQALDKMLEEMNHEHSPSEDRIHNWLCEQDDDELFQGILKDGYTIKCSLDYVKGKAREFAKNGVACIDDETVFGWIREYFLSNSKLDNIQQVPVEKVKKVNDKLNVVKAADPESAKKKVKKEKGVVETQMSIFDFLDE
ncbi:Cas9 inhibitor AcrIIA9 family protein [Streptococcus constellatus]|uniref:Cas9 inhibitor AcrIIA9 family protein n=1 Tax=Streptococcus constellatus TaxID=76860 RepID=UPI0028E31D2D|nr:Cas9 inhibitor AcrIIA9 family protein [Streptococcus constellatus]